jgi:hypothetical protein
LEYLAEEPKVQVGRLVVETGGVQPIREGACAQIRVDVECPSAVLGLEVHEFRQE